MMEYKLVLLSPILAAVAFGCVQGDPVDDISAVQQQVDMLLSANI